MEGFIGIISVLLLLAVVLWIYAIYDVVKGTFRGSGSKTLWLIVIIFFPILGAILYLIFGRGKGD